MEERKVIIRHVKLIYYNKYKCTGIKDFLSQHIAIKQLNHASSPSEQS